MVNASTEHQAPDSLEDVRILLNSWLIPNDTRVPEDRFDDYADQHNLRPEARADLRRLRDDLRASVERSVDAGAVINGWIERCAVRPHVDGAMVRYRHGGGVAGKFLVAVLDAIAAGRWPRLKACPDCRWVFYDHSRNASKRWCLMTAGGSDGRSCGSIAKVKAYRERTRQANG